MIQSDRLASVDDLKKMLREREASTGEEPLSMSLEQEEVVAQSRTSNARTRLDNFKHELFDLRLRNHQPLATFVKSITAEYDRFIQALLDYNSVSSAALLRTSMGTAAKELRETTKALEAERLENKNLRGMVDELVAANEKHAETQKTLEDYVDELRACLAAHNNKLLVAADGETLLPDDPAIGPYTDAVRKMAAEIENLRVENLRLSELGIQQIAAFEEQSEELSALLDRANDFQQQAGSLKGTIRVMKDYIDQLERRVKELSVTYSDRMGFAFDKISQESSSRTLWFNQRHLQGFATWYACSTRGLALEGDKNPTLLADPLPGFEAVPLSATCAPAPGHPFVPCHLRSSTSFPLKFRSVGLEEAEATFTDIQQSLNVHLVPVMELLMNWKTTSNVKIAVVTKPYDEWLAGWYRHKHHNSRAATEAAYLYEQAATHFQMKSIKALTFHMMCHRLLPLDFPTHFLPKKLSQLREALRRIEPKSKKTKDKVPRSEFLKVVKGMFPRAATHDVMTVIAYLSSVTQETKALQEDIQYEPYFEPLTPPQQVMHDALVRLVIYEVILVRDRLIQKWQSMAHDEFNSNTAMIEAEFSVDLSQQAAAAATGKSRKKKKAASELELDFTPNRTLAEVNLQAQLADKGGSRRPPEGGVLRLLADLKTGPVKSVEKMLTITSVEDDGVGCLLVYDIAQSLLAEDPTVEPLELRRRLFLLTKNIDVFDNCYDSTAQLETRNAEDGTPAATPIVQPSDISTNLKSYVISLEALIENVHQMCCIGTTPDRT